MVALPQEFAEVFRSAWPKVVAALVRDLGDIDLAEDCAQDAFVAASKNWRTGRWPDAPEAWLITTARRKAIDQLRRAERFDQRIPELTRRAETEALTAGATGGSAGTAHGLVDDRLALILGCCHPVLAPEGQVALTLRLVAGLSTAQIARGFLVSESTMRRRITRAKRKIGETNGSSGATTVFHADRERLEERLPSVCAVIYSIYTEGHASATGATLVRGDMCDEALWLAGLVAELVPEDPEVGGLLALLLLSDARRSSRIGADGSVILLADQDRTQWDQEKITGGRAALAQAYAAGRRGPYQLQAAIAALHATAPSFEETDWSRIIDLYDVLIADGRGDGDENGDGDPVLALNRAAAIGHHQGPAAGLAAIDDLHQVHHERLADYPYFHGCQAEFLAATGEIDRARRSFAQALKLTNNAAEQELLRTRIEAMDGEST